LDSVSGITIDHELSRGYVIIQREVYFSDFGNALLKLSKGKDLLDNEGKKVDVEDMKTKRVQEMCEKLYFRLKEYFDGSYRKMYNGPMQFDIDNKLTVFETNQLDPKNVSELAYLLCLFNTIYEYSQRSDLVGILKYLFLEEGWVFLGNPAVAYFLSDIFRTSRKHGLSSLVITQQPEDFLSTQAGRGVLANAPNRFLLQQEKDTVQYIADQLKLSDLQANVMAGVRTQKGYYSEIYIKSQRAEGVYRLVPDPVLYWIMSSDKSDKHLRNVTAKEYIRNNIPGVLALAKSVVKCASQYPYGVDRSEADPEDPLIQALASIDLRPQDELDGGEEQVDEVLEEVN
jgi:hypothetical protein